MKTDAVTTHDIRLGDRIANYGMVLLVDREPTQTRHPVDNAGGITLATKAVIENWDELVTEAEAGNSTAQYLVALADQDYEGTHRWTIQGNGWAHWGRIV